MSWIGSEEGTRRLQRVGGVLEEHAHQRLDPERHLLRPSGQDRHVAPRPLFVRSEVAQQHRHPTAITAR